MPPPLAVWWLRRDLRLHDNAALYHALRSGPPVLPVFIFDRDILDELPALDHRVLFIHRELSALRHALTELDSGIWFGYGRPTEIWKQLLDRFDLAAVYTNRDYEPYALRRDEAVADLLRERGVAFHTYKDHVVFDPEDEIRTGAGRVYTVFTPYKKAWLRKLTPFHLKAYPTESYFDHLYRVPSPFEMPTLEEMGFRDAQEASFPPRTVSDDLLEQYADRRNFPGQAGTSQLGVHLRFGTVSIREVARQAQRTSETFLSEIAWRDFYAQILAHFPEVVDHAFKPAYDRIPWRRGAEAEADFARWCAGQTGYPMVDAGMRELNTTGYMHNRVRMVVASFLTKHLLLDWRWGEAYFAEKLLDYELASNNGNWQWAAGSGCDAAPYFRVFNPTEQIRKFDPGETYIRRWVPELDTPDYPAPIIEHRTGRIRALETYKAALQSES